MPDEYNSSYTGPQIDAAVGKALSPDSTPTADSQNLITSGAVKSALNAKADQTDLASIHATGTTNATGATINIGTYFYLNDVLVQALVSIQSGATFTNGTNYTTVTAGALNRLRDGIRVFVTANGPNWTRKYTFPGGYKGVLTAVSAATNAKGIGLINVTSTGTVSVTTVAGSLSSLAFNTSTSYELTITDPNGTYAVIAVDSLNSFAGPTIS